MTVLPVDTTRTHWLRLMPGLFVVLWSTGFIGAKYGLPYADPLTFLALRAGIVASIMVAIAWVARAPRPRHWRDAGHAAVVGLLIQGVYLGGVYLGIARGVPAGLSALIVGLQPALTAALVGFLGEEVSGRQWLGIVLGLAGVVLVVGQKLSLVSLGAGSLAPLLAVAVGLGGITIGTLYQKRLCAGIDLCWATLIQNAAAAVAMLILARCFEAMRILWTGQFVFALLWLCLVLSVGATMLFLFLVNRGAAARVTSLFYLVPPVTAFMAFLFFGERLGPLALGGMGLTAVGVALVNRA